MTLQGHCLQFISVNKFYEVFHGLPKTKRLVEVKATQYSPTGKFQSKGESKLI